MNKLAIPLFLLVVVGLIAAGLYLGGFLENDEALDASGGDGQVAESSEGDTGTSGGPSGVPVSPIKTAQFTPSVDGSGVTTRLDGRETGIALTGVVTDPNGEPLAKAKVALIRDLSQVKTRAQEGDTLLELSTEADGRFRFQNLARGEIYVLRAKHAEYTTERRHPIDPFTPATLQQTIKLKDGVGIAGAVTDSNGSPLEGVEVSVYDTNVSNADPLAKPEQWSTTDATGKYGVEHLTAGLKKVIVRKEGFGTDGRNGVNLKDETEGARDVNFTLGAGFTIRGHVKDQRTDAPIADALVTARVVSMLAQHRQNPRPSADEAAGDAGGQDKDRSAPNRGRRPSRNMMNARAATAKSFLTSSTRTDEDGNFVITGVLEARYLLSVKARGYQDSHGRSADFNTDSNVIEMVQSARILGRVIDDESGKPVASFTVATSATPTPLFTAARSRQRFQTEDGTFSYVDVPPGKHYLIGAADGYAGGRTEPIVVLAEQEVTGIEIRLVRGATIRGVVRDTEGQAVKGARISLAQPSSGDPAADIFRRLIGSQMRVSSDKTTSTDKNGEWKIPHILAGRYSIKVVHRNYTDAETAPVTCEDRGVVDAPEVTLARGGTISGVVLKKNGAPDGKATVMITSDDPKVPVNRSMTTNSKGEFEAKGLKAGVYRVVVAQRNGEFDLLKILQSRQDPKNIVTVRDGELVKLEL
ncbi:MAG: hypothetical protein CMJ83_02415 [Planctomycetes bacterium]|nr:hypothetical protein [Planctomycetota bacterium]